MTTLVCPCFLSMTCLYTCRCMLSDPFGPQSHVPVINSTVKCRFKIDFKEKCVIHMPQNNRWKYEWFLAVLLVYLCDFLKSTAVRDISPLCELTSPVCLWQQPSRIFPFYFPFELLQKVSSETNKCLWFLNVFFIMVIFTNEHNVYTFWSLITISRCTPSSS